MAQTMTPSGTESKTMTEGQITKAVGLYRALLEKHASEFDSGVVQSVLGDPQLAGEMFGVFRQRVEARASEVVRRATGVDRTLSPADLIAKVVATGRTEYVDEKVVKTMPKGEGDEPEVVFFKIGRFITDDDLEREYEKRGLVPVDPYSLATINMNDPAFDDERPNATHWKDSKGWCYAMFSRLGGGRKVGVDRSDSGWGDLLWFAGARK